MLKRANELAGGLQGGEMAPPPAQAVPQEQAGQIPPEIEQLINSLPPEALEQLLAEVEQAMQGGGDPSQGGMPPQGDPSQGGMPPQGMPPQGMPPQGDPSQGMKQASAIIANEPAYIEGFMARAAEVGLDKHAAVKIYKEAVAIMAPPAPAQKTASYAPAPKNAHKVGFVAHAKATYNCSEKQAEELYENYFGK